MSGVCVPQRDRRARHRLTVRVADVAGDRERQSVLKEAPVLHAVLARQHELAARASPFAERLPRIGEGSVVGSYDNPEPPGVSVGTGMGRGVMNGDAGSNVLNVVQSICLEYGEPLAKMSKPWLPPSVKTSG